MLVALCKIFQLLGCYESKFRIHKSDQVYTNRSCKHKRCFDLDELREGNSELQHPDTNTNNSISVCKR
jgi:hypothetical protein